MCISLFTIAIHGTAQNSSDNHPFYPPDIIIVQMLSAVGEG